MGAFNIDANGQIIVDDSMSEELKEKIRIYNGCLNSPDINDVEISEEEADRFDVPDDPEDSLDDPDDEYVEIEVDDSIDQEQLNDLNDLFS